jgi:hypothetical protein
VTVLVGHVTKKGQIAGPKDLEHNVDCVLYIRRAFRLRPHMAARSTAVHGYAGIGDDLAEGQASVSLPRYGSRPELNAPFLPGKKVRQLLSVLLKVRPGSVRLPAGGGVVSLLGEEA